jgi:hypothetical protein
MTSLQDEEKKIQKLLHKGLTNKKMLTKNFTFKKEFLKKESKFLGFSTEKYNTKGNLYIIKEKIDNIHKDKKLNLDYKGKNFTEYFNKINDDVRKYDSNIYDNFSTHDLPGSSTRLKFSKTASLKKHMDLEVEVKTFSMTKSNKIIKKDSPVKAVKGNNSKNNKNFKDLTSKQTNSKDHFYSSKEITELKPLEDAKIYDLEYTKTEVNQNQNQNQNLNPDDDYVEYIEKLKKTDNYEILKKPVEMSVWISEEFPIKLSHFIPLIHILSFISSEFAELKSSLSNKFLPFESFPLKISFPLGLTFYAFLQVTNYSSSISDPDSIFKLDYSKELNVEKDIKKIDLNDNKYAQDFYERYYEEKRNNPETECDQSILNERLHEVFMTEESDFSKTEKVEIHKTNNREYYSVENKTNFLNTIEIGGTADPYYTDKTLIPDNRKTSTYMNLRKTPTNLIGGPFIYKLPAAKPNDPNSGYFNCDIHNLYEDYERKSSNTIGNSQTTRKLQDLKYFSHSQAIHIQDEESDRNDFNIKCNYNCDHNSLNEKQYTLDDLTISQMILMDKQEEVPDEKESDAFPRRKKIKIPFTPTPRLKKIHFNFEKPQDGKKDKIYDNNSNESQKTLKCSFKPKLMKNYKNFFKYKSNEQKESELINQIDLIRKVDFEIEAENKVEEKNKNEDLKASFQSLKSESSLLSKIGCTVF